MKVHINSKLMNVLLALLPCPNLEPEREIASGQDTKPMMESKDN